MEKKYKIETFSNREEWLKGRGFGGSSASAIVGKNKWKTKNELYNEIIYGNKNKNIVNDSILYGTQCEDLIRQMFALDYKDKYKVISPSENKMFRRIDKPYLTATLDGELEDVQNGNLGILEIKTHDVRNSRDLEEWDGHLPDNYFIQCLHYLIVRNDCNFVVLCAKLRFFDYFNEDGKTLTKQEIRYYFISRDEFEDQILWLENKETQFYEDIQKRKIPAVKISF